MWQAAGKSRLPHCDSLATSASQRLTAKFMQSLLFALIHGHRRMNSQACAGAPTDRHPASSVASHDSAMSSVQATMRPRPKATEATTDGGAATGAAGRRSPRLTGQTASLDNHNALAASADIPQEQDMDVELCDDQADRGQTTEIAGRASKLPRPVLGVSTPPADAAPVRARAAVAHSNGKTARSSAVQHIRSDRPERSRPAPAGRTRPTTDPARPAAPAGSRASAAAHQKFNASPSPVASEAHSSRPRFWKAVARAAQEAAKPMAADVAGSAAIHAALQTTGSQSAAPTAAPLAAAGVLLPAVGSRIPRLSKWESPARGAQAAAAISPGATRAPAIAGKPQRRNAVTPTAFPAKPALSKDLLATAQSHLVDTTPAQAHNNLCLPMRSQPECAALPPPEAVISLRNPPTVLSTATG